MICEPIMQWFSFAHLPVHLQAVSRPFCELAQRLVETMPRSAERTVALRKLLESKDAAVRASMIQPDATKPCEHSEHWHSWTCCSCQKVNLPISDRCAGCGHFYCGEKKGGT